jgi:hypothetical protein
MSAWLRLQSRAIRMFAVALLLVGFVPIAYGVGLFAWQCVTWVNAHHWVPLPARLLLDHGIAQAASLTLAERFPTLHRVVLGLLDMLPLTLFVAALGALAASMGRSIAAWQADLLRAAAERESDRLRRRQEYLKEESNLKEERRIEPW